MEFQTILTLLILKFFILPFDSYCYYIQEGNFNIFKSLYKPTHMSVHGYGNLNITIVDSFIPTLSMKSFLINQHQQFITILIVHNNSINNIDADEIILSLTLLDASHNNLNDLSNLNNFPNLINIDLQYNVLTDITPNFLSMHNQLITLNLSHNIIRNLPIVSTEAQSLQSLDLGYNKINDITLECFENMPNLTTLNLNNNNITNIHSGYFQKLTSLLYLDISHNNIMYLEISCFSGLGRLKRLNISFNKLTSLPEHIFHNTGSLVELFLRNNSLTMLDPDDLLHSTHLEMIDVDQNVMTCKMIAHLLKSFKTQKVTVVQGSSFGNISLNGINCIHDEDFIISNSNNSSEIMKEVYADFKRSDLFNFFKKINSSVINGIPVAFRDNSVNETILNTLVNYTADIARSNENNIIFKHSAASNLIQELTENGERENKKLMISNLLLTCLLICCVMQLIFKCYIYWKPGRWRNQEQNELHIIN